MYCPQFRCFISNYLILSKKNYNLYGYQFNPFSLNYSIKKINMPYLYLVSIVLYYYYLLYVTFFLLLMAKYLIGYFYIRYLFDCQIKEIMNKKKIKMRFLERMNNHTQYIKTIFL